MAFYISNGGATFALQTIGMKNKLKVFRAMRNMGQSELAEQLGVTRQTIHAVENGKFVPSTLLAMKMAALLDTKVEELFELEESDWKQE
jgi:putative transcriptional regulator